MTKHTFWTASFQCLAKSLATTLGAGQSGRLREVVVYGKNQEKELKLN